LSTAAGITKAATGGGSGLFRLACDHDLEGVVAKWKFRTYQTNGRTSWLKMKRDLLTEGRPTWVVREASSRRRPQALATVAAGVYGSRGTSEAIDLAL